ncbi:MAG: T9SS type A sorting domain-containing protein, partial [Mariniphaga sp.]|nr:T9SS type A sorting domain-containing protein [Mariniphaga sp.]
NGPFSLGFELPGDMGSYNQIESAIFNVEPEQPNGVAKPELSNNTFLYNPSGYNLTMDEAFGATEYEWITTYGSISGTTNSVTLNTERTTVVSVRAYNEICDIYSPMENATISITYGPVSGSGSLCSSGSNYTLTNVPTGYSVTWSATPSYKFQTSSGTGTTAFLQPTSSAYGDGTITFTILGQNYSKPFTINPPDPSDVSLSLYTSGGSPASYMCPDTYYHIYINNSGGCSLSNYSWSIPAAWDSMYQSSNMISVYTNSTPGGMVEVDAYISCCNETRKVITDYLYSGYCGGYYSMIFTPNPSELETTLSIESTKEEVQFDDNEEWELEVYDQTQILKEKKNKIKGSKYKIKTQSWKEGIYIVRVKYKDEILQGKLVVKK